jgi:hypothetical protein
MKRDIAEYVSLCDTYQRVKAEHQRPAGLLQPLKIPEWKWEEIRMDFIVGLPRTQARYDSIWVIVDRLTKVAHFIPIKTTYSGAKLAEREESMGSSVRPSPELRRWRGGRATAVQNRRQRRSVRGRLERGEKRREAGRGVVNSGGGARLL